MIGYTLYFLLAVGLTMLLTASFRRLRRDDQRPASPQDEAAFDRRMARIEQEFSVGQGGPRRPGGGDGGRA